MKHFYRNFIFCKDNFFRNPQRVSNFANSLDYNFTFRGFPGSRTENLMFSSNQESREFAEFFAKKLINEIYTNITDLKIDVRFHRYPRFDDENLNNGWIHIDDNELLAGLVYLNENVNKFDSGTSFFTGPKRPSSPDSIREKFNLDYESVNITDYKDQLNQHNSQFQETITVGNLYNRLITYDSLIYHKPNNYYIDELSSRLILVFVISEYHVTNRRFHIME